MQNLDRHFPVGAFVLVLAGCGGQTLSANPVDSGASDARQADDSAAAGPNDATPLQVDDDTGTSSVGPNDATAVELDASLPEASTGDCLSICETKGASCGAPSSAVVPDCLEMCNESPTPAQLACIQSSSCSSLAAGFENDGTVCGIGQDGG
jgi:hypothetical protein